jgi:hypothetical protein
MHIDYCRITNMKKAKPQSELDVLSSVFIAIFKFEKLRCVQFGTSDESFQNHHLAGTRVTVKLALRAGPSGQLVELAIRL